jgi:hypothetical protein
VPAVAFCVVATAAARADEPVHLPAVTRSSGDVRLEFPEVIYRPPVVGADPTADYAAAISAALGIGVDPVRDHLADAQNRVLFRHPENPGVLLKIYKTEGKSPRVIAKLLQRDLAIADLLGRLGVAHARVADLPALRERGAVQQDFVKGTGLDALHPGGYRPGTDARVDRLLETLAPYDEGVRLIVGRQLGLTARNDVDCRTMRSLGFDLGHCYGNIFVAAATGEALLVDW